MKKVIKIITTALLSGTLLTSFISPLSNQAKAGWERDNNGWWYSLKYGDYYKNGRYDLNGKFYRFDKRGYMVTGWYFSKEGNHWEYYDPINGDQKFGWLYVNGKWYLSNGIMQTGYVLSSNKHYYLDPVNGNMKTGWIKLKNNSNKEHWYYFDPVSGAAVENSWKYLNGKWYYFNAAYASEGFTFVGKKKYYFNPINCDMKTGWIYVAGDIYYADSNDGGALATNKTLRIGGVSYTFDGTGRLIHEIDLKKN